MPGKSKMGLHTARRQEVQEDAMEGVTTDMLEGKKKPSYFGQQNNDEVESPDNLMTNLQAEFGFMFDPCPFVGKGKHPDFCGKEIEWKQMNYVNPPYAERRGIEQWIDKAVKEKGKDRTSIMFIPARVGSRYWEGKVFAYANELRCITGKIMFKGYNTPSPHHLALVIFRSESEKSACACNTNWRLPELLDARPDLRLEFPVLAGVIEKAQVGVDEHSYYGYESALTWAIQAWSAYQLLDELEAETLNPIIRHHILPLFIDMINVYQRCKGPFKEYICDFEENYPFPELFRRLAYAFSQSEELSDIFAAQRNSEDQPWQSLVAFYTAFSINDQMRVLTANRESYQRISHDGDFTENVMFIKP